MATTVATYPANVVATPGNGSTRWSNPNNVKANDANVAGYAYFLDNNGNSADSDSLTMSNFGFAIPTGATIDGITVEVGYGSSNRVVSAILQLLKNGATVGQNKANYSSLITTAGSASDLWGTTWTPADINNPNFGILSTFGFTSNPADANVGVNYYRITVEHHFETTVPTMPADVPTRNIHKIYSPSGSYLGKLPDDTSGLSFPLEINTSGTSITLDCPVTIDVAAGVTNYLITEAGDYLTDESGNRLTTEGQPPIANVGTNTDTTTLFRNGNRIVSIEYSYWYPNGKVLFRGQINRLNIKYAEDAGSTIRLMALSDGLDLDNLIARGAPFVYTNDQSQTTYSAGLEISQQDRDGGFIRYGQTWTVGSGVTNLGAIKIVLKGSANVTVSVYDSVSLTTLLGSSKQTVNVSSETEITFAMPSIIPTNAGSQYFFTVAVDANQSINIYYAGSGGYAGGQLYTSNYSGGSGGGSYSSISASDLYFITASGTGSTTAVFNSKDPATGMVKPVLDDYTTRGGLIRYTSSSIAPTGLSLSYTFNTNTVLDVFKKALDLSPNGFYFFVDPGTRIAYFKSSSSVADIKFTKGKHIGELELSLSIENVKNQFLFSGGNPSGSMTNLYKKFEDISSQARYGVRLERKADSRVTLDSTANAIGTSFIAENKDEMFYTTVRIINTKMDITQLRPGLTVGFNGFGNYIDRLLLVITRVVYAGEYADVSLGSIPVRQSDAIEETVRGLLAEQTVDNPTTPS